VIDLGAGNGRIAAPLHDAGHEVLAIDSDLKAVDACEARGLQARRADMLVPDADLAHPSGLADAIVCVGNTFAQVSDVGRAADLLRRLRAVTTPNGWFAIDSITPIWNEVAQGNWQAGVSEDGEYELVWAPGDAVVWFDRTDGTPDADDPLCAAPLRLWSLGALRLLALASGWGPPVEREEQSLTVLMRPGSA
jgi:SAM-dependent methyltransferase